MYSKFAQFLQSIWPPLWMEGIEPPLWAVYFRPALLQSSTFVGRRANGHCPRFTPSTNRSGHVTLHLLARAIREAQFVAVVPAMLIGFILDYLDSLDTVGT
jgi:hypothetical protein